VLAVSRKAARIVLSAGLVAAALAAALGQVVAAVQNYDLSIACPACGSGSHFGMIVATEIANADLSILVQLDPNIRFARNQNDNRHALAFSLIGNPTVTISNLSDARFSADGSQAAHTVEAPPFTAGSANFEYEINFERNVNGQQSAPLSTLSFDIGGATPLSLAPIAGYGVNCTDC